MRLLYHRGRVGLCAILRAMGMAPGDEVVIPAYTCVAVPEGVIAAGGRPVFADLEKDGFNMDPGQLESCFSSRTRAVVIQHTFGLSADMEHIGAVALKREVPVIEDCCHLRVFDWQRMPDELHGIAAFFSYEWGKPVVAGVGGEVVCKDSSLLAQLGANYSMYKRPSILASFRLATQYYAFRLLYHPRRYWSVRNWFRRLSRLRVAVGNYNIAGDGQAPPGYDMRMDSLAVGRLEASEGAKPHRDWSTAYRETITCEGVRHPSPIPGRKYVYARYPMRVSNKEVLLGLARARGLEMADWYSSPIHPLTGKELETVGYQEGSCPNAEERCRETVTLPVNEKVNMSYVKAVAAMCNEYGG